MSDLQFTDPTVADYSILNNKLVELHSTNDGQMCIISRYGSCLTPSQIINSLQDAAIVMFVKNASNELMGYCNISKPVDDNYCELSYFIFPEYTNQGFGYQSAEYMLTKGLKMENVLGVKCESEVTNMPSQKILEKLASKFNAIKIDTNTNYNPNTKIYFWNKS